VNDGHPFGTEQLAHLRNRLNGIPVVFLSNERLSGAAGSWNTGLTYLRSAQFDGYVAILDDDDQWDSNHICLNLQKAEEIQAELVVSGLRRVVHGQEKPRAFPADLKSNDFLRGNPGLQGSNTFVTLTALNNAGNFTDGLPSLNDRDMAFRLLKLPVKVAYTNQWTASWHHDTNRPTLSAPRSVEKIVGLQWFWKQYKSEMSSVEKDAYIQRAWKCFGVTYEEIQDDWGIPAQR
jgi:glycosyltransferase involved in cell wall biosynthesis